jgi:hypothetical protein
MADVIQYNASKVNVQAFTTTFTFVPNGWNLAFVLQNNTNSSAGTGTYFAAGAGCEAGFYQAFDGAPPNNVFALELDSQSYLDSSETFTYSSVQIYQQGQSPCNPNDNQPNYYLTDKISTSPVPLTSPANSLGSTTGDTYSATITYDGTNVVLKMYDMTAGGSCPGSTCFTYTWTDVNIPSLVNGTTAWVGLSTATNEASNYPLYVDSFGYSSGATAQAATPTFSPAAGTYSGAQSVTISDGTSGATIYYTTNGTTPGTSSTRYSGPITVSSTETLQAIAVATGNTNSVVASAAYTITPQATVATPAFSPGAGTYGSAQLVTISDATSDAIIYYTTNGTTPTTSSTEYTGPITVSSTETLEAIAAATGYTDSTVASAAYSIGSSSSQLVVSTPAFSPASGAYTSAQPVTISDATSGATIYYTTNGTTPTTSSTEYTGPITVSSTETLEAIAVATGDTNSAVASAAYTITASLPSVSTPAFSPAAGTYTSAQSVTISDATSGATIYYTTNGTTPTASSTQYSGPVTVSRTETLQAIAAVATGNSAVASAAYSITSQPNFVLGTSAASLTVNSGGQGAVTLTVTPENGFDSPVILACSAVPSWATCSFDQATVTPSGGAVSTQLTISASAQSSALQPRSRPFFPFTAMAMTVCLFGLRKRRGRLNWLLLAVAYAGLGLLFGCGGTSGGGGPSSTPAQTPTTSTVTITAISGTLQGTAAIALTVN